MITSFSSLIETKKSRMYFYIHSTFRGSDHSEEFFGVLFYDRFCLLLTSVELVYRTCLEKCLLSCIERVTSRTCFNTDLLVFDTTFCFKSISTRTENFYRFKLRVNIFSHNKKGVKSICESLIPRLGKGTKCLSHFFVAKCKTEGEYIKFD